MKLIVILALTILVSACTEQKPDPKDSERGVLRHKLFVECMDISAKHTRQADDRVAEVIESCGKEAYFMSYQIIQK